MKILLVGSGGREDALCQALMRSRHNVELTCFGGNKNPNIAAVASEFVIGNPVNQAELCAFMTGRKFDFAIVGADDPICAGAADTLTECGVRVVAPLKKLAQLEASKAYTRELLAAHGVAGAPLFAVCRSADDVRVFAATVDEIVVKFDALAGGKGVQVQGDHFSTTEEGVTFAEECIATTGFVVVEEKLVGQEFSLICAVDGRTVAPMPLVQDNKRALDGDRGPNTGGMGTISAADGSLPFLRTGDAAAALAICEATIAAVQATEGGKFVGFLFGGFIATATGVKLIEFNVRFGDPESLNLLTLLETDFVDLCLAMLDGKLAELMPLRFKAQATVCKYLVPTGYPESPAKGTPVKIDRAALPDGVALYCASLDGDSNLLGSRAVGIVACAADIPAAEAVATAAYGAVSGDLVSRSDIGTAGVLVEKAAMMAELRG